MSYGYTFSGLRLRDARERAGLSRELLAISSATGYSAIALYETGHRCPPREVLIRLADALGIRPADLVDADPLFAAVAQ